MLNKQQYKEKLISGDEAAGMVKSGMLLDYGFMEHPKMFDRFLSKRRKDLQDIRIRMLGLQSLLDVLEGEDENGSSFFLEDFFPRSPYRERYSLKGVATFIPHHFGELPDYYREKLLPSPDMAVIVTSPMRNGYFNFGVSITFIKALCEVAKKVIVEVNENMPWVHGGYDECIHISDVDYIIENNQDELTLLPASEIEEPGDEEKAIAEILCGQIPRNGPTIQVGLGRVPNAVLKAMASYGIHNVGIHTEMLTQSIMDLTKAGIITCKKKTLFPGKIVHCFAGGDANFYKWLHTSPPIVLGFPVNFANNAQVLAMNDNLVTINAALEIDLLGQVNSETIGARQYSGTGGQLEFCRAGYYRSPAGFLNVGFHSNKAFTCFPSTYFNRKTGELKSRIVPALPRGAVITVPRSDVTNIVTEWGMASLKGKTAVERVKEIIKIAHPDFRAWLREEALKMGLLPKRFA